MARAEIDYIRIIPFDSHLDRNRFRCGKDDLDVWLKTQAGQQERRNNTRTFLAVDDSGHRIVGYYATTAYRLELDERAAALGAGRRKYPIEAVTFYTRFGFTRFEDHGLHLFMTTKNLEQRLTTCDRFRRALYLHSTHEMSTVKVCLET